MNRGLATPIGTDGFGLNPPATPTGRDEQIEGRDRPMARAGEPFLEDGTNAARAEKNAAARGGETHRSSTRPWLVAGAIVAGCLLYGFLTMTPGFDTNDDPAMLAISIGLFTDGIPDPRLVYQSALLGALLAGFASIAPAFDAYSALQWAVCIAGFLTMSHVLLRRDSSPFGIATVAVANSIFLPPFLFNLQFVQTSFVCLATGLVLLIDAMRKTPPGWRGMAWAIGWMLVASLYRSATLMAAEATIAIVLVLAVADRALDRDRSGLLRDASMLSAFAIVLAVLATGASALERTLFYADPGWRSFYDHLADRPYVLENWPRWIGLERIVGTLQRELGVTPEQYFSMALWIPISRDAYAIGRFSEMADVIRGIDVDPAAVRAMLGTLLALGREFFANAAPFRLCLWIIGLIAVLGTLSNGARRTRAIALGLFWISVPCAFWLAIAIVYRPPPPRVWMSIVALAFWGSLACRAVLPKAPEGLAEQRFRMGILGLVALALALAGPLPVHGVIRHNAQIRAELRDAHCRTSREHVAIFEGLPEGAHVFLAPQVVNAECFIRPFDRDYPKVLTERVHSFGWRVLTPRIHETLFATDEDLFVSICRNPANMFVANPPTQRVVESYLRRHRPGIVLRRYAEHLPETILACRTTDPGEAPADAGRRRPS